MMLRYASGLMAIAAVVLMGTGTASAQQKPKTPAKPQSQQQRAAEASGPVELGKFGDWGAYATQTSRGKVCYALSEPKTREPAGLKRDPGYLFISIRPAENIRGEVSFRFGFSPKENSESRVSVGQSNYTFYTQNEGAWIRNAVEEAQLIEAMRKGQAIIARVTSMRGNATSDRYSLSGFGQAFERATQECAR